MPTTRTKETNQIGFLDDYVPTATPTKVLTKNKRAYFLQKEANKWAQPYLKYDSSKPLSKTNVYYKRITDPDEANKMLLRLKKYPLLAVDIETNNSLDYETGEIITIQFTAKAHTSVMMLWPAALANKALLWEILTDPKITKVYHNMMFDIPFLAHKIFDGETELRIRREEDRAILTSEDTQIYAYVVHGYTQLDKTASKEEKENNGLSLDFLCGKFLGAGKYKYKDLGVLDPMSDGGFVYSCRDTDLTFQLYHELKKDCPEELQTTLLIERNAIIGTLEANRAGCYINTDLIHIFKKGLLEELSELEQKIRTYVPEKYSLTSNQQMGDFLYNECKIPITDELKTKKGQASVSGKVLKLIYDKHPVIPLLLEHKKLVKLITSYTDSLLDKIENNILHGEFNQFKVITGRYSSSDPNLQQMPRPKIALEPGMDEKKLIAAFNQTNFRAIYSPRPGYVLLKADYSGQEVVVLAELSGDANLRRMVTEGHDIHAAFAIKAFKAKDADGRALDPFNKADQKILKKLHKELRTRAKSVVFGISYGISKFKLAYDTMTEANIRALSNIIDPVEREQFLLPLRDEAQKLIDEFYDMFPGVYKWQKDTQRTVKKRGYCETATKRRRYLNTWEGNKWERECINTPIQGTCGDIIKWVLYKLTKRFHDDGLDAKIVLTCHDEVLIESRISIKSEVSKIFYEIMKNHILEFVHFDLPLTAEVDECVTWGWETSLYNQYKDILLKLGRTEDLEFISKYDLKKE